jgi:formate/nitrite transporter FocA (FNT family)
VPSSSLQDLKLVFFTLHLYQLLAGKVGENTIFKLFSLVYPVGFILVVVGKSAFYGTNLSTNFTCAKWATKVIELLRIWGVVILGNVVGGILFTLFIYLAPELKLFTHETMIAIGEHVVHYDSWVLFLSAISWMAYGLLNWLLNSTINSLTRILLIL